MHTVLLLFRSVVLAAATSDVSAGCGDSGSGGGGAGGGGVGEAAVDFATHATERADHTLVQREVENHDQRDSIFSLDHRPTFL